MAADKISTGFSNSVKSYVSHNIESITTAAAIDASVEAATNQYKQETANKVVATVTDFLGNAFSGILSVLDQVIDGAAVFIVGDVIIPAYEAIGSLDLGEISLDLDILSGDDGIAGNAGRNTLDLKVDTSHFKEQAEDLKKWQREFTEGNRFQEFDELLGESEFISEYSTCSDQTKQLAKGFGTMTAYIGIGSIPYAGPVLSGFGAAGSAVQTAYDTGATYEEAQAVGTVAGVAGLVTDGLLNKIGVAAKGAKSFTKAMGFTALGTITAEIEPLANALTQYLTYGHAKYGFGWDGFNDFLTENGYYAQFAMAGAAGFVRTFVSAAQSEGFKGGIKKVKEKIKGIINDENTNNDLYVHITEDKLPPKVKEIVDDYKIEVGITQLQKSDYCEIVKRLDTVEDKEAFFKSFVVDSSMSQFDSYVAKLEYEAEHGEGTWYEKSFKERERFKNSIKLDKANEDLYKAKYDVERTEVASDALKNLKKLEETGKLKEGYTYEMLLEKYYDGVSPKEYLSTDYLKSLYENFKVDDEGYITVVTWQSADSGAKSVTKFGSIGSPTDGAFATSYDTYDKLIHDTTIFYENGNCKSSAKLTEALGGVEVGCNPIAIKQKIYVGTGDEGFNNFIELLPKGDNAQAYIGEWLFGGYTSGGAPEIVVPSTKYYNEDKSRNNLVEIISHSATESLESIEARIKKVQFK